MVNIGIIGGTGFSEKKVEEMKKIKTDYDSVYYDTLSMGGKEVVFIPRHAALDVPHLVNYRGNIQAMKILGVDTVFAVSACGRLGEEALPGKLGIVTDIDWDDLNREMSYAEHGLLLHASMNPAFSKPLQDYLREAWDENRAEFYDLHQQTQGLDFGLVREGTYFNINGPDFLPPAKEARLRNTVDNAMYVGQTLVPEAQLARQMALAYAGLAMIVDHSSYPGAPSTVHHADGVMYVVKHTTKMASALLEKTIEQIPDDFHDPVCHDALTHSLHESQVDIEQLQRSQRYNLANILKQELESRKEEVTVD